MNVIVDAYGGDHAPLEILKGTAAAVQEFHVQATVCGIESELRELAAKEGISLEGIQFVHAPMTMPVDVDPTELLKSYKESSLAVGLNLLAQGQGDAFISAGSTGAILVGATLIVKRAKGIKRAALGTVIPTTTGRYMLIDVGANSECRPEMLLQFGVMGSVYMQTMMGVEKPRVGMINIGTEPNKGTELQIQANELLQKAPIHFIGNVEGRGLPLGDCDVAVGDGFTGNIVLKVTEGMGKLMSIELKNLFLGGGIRSKLAAILVRSDTKKLSKKMDYKEYGGAPLMGISKPVIKAHGSSDSVAFKNAIKQACNMVENNMIERMNQSLALLKEE